MVAYLANKACLIVVVTFSLNCTNAKSPINSEPEAPRIIFGQSIEEVIIGDDSLAVINMLGKPTDYQPDDFKGYTMVYGEGYLRYTFVKISRDSLFGLGIISVTVEGPYKGITKDGVGIGSKRDIVISKIGKQDSTFQGQYPLIYDMYFYNKNTFVITYEENHIKRISMVK